MTDKQQKNAQQDFSTLHWSFAAVKKTIAQQGEQKRYTCASGITPSGIIHIGNFRELITVDLVTRAFKRMGYPVRHIHSWDDNDVFRKVPKGMPQQEMLQENLRKCIVDIPDPYGKEDSYAKKHMKDVEDAVAQVGIFPDYIRQSVKYRNCDYAEDIKVALENTSLIKELLNEHRREPLADSWLPVSLFCSACQKDTISRLEYKGRYILSYDCKCGHTEDFDFRKVGIVKLVWRVDWPMRWAYENVNFEPGGKDHSTTGGSYDTGKNIVQQVWNKTAPSYLMYDFIRIKGGSGKISSSSGEVITLKDCLVIYEPEIIRYLFAGTRPNAEFAISFDADVIKVYEDYDKCERIYYGVEKVKEKEAAKQRLIYEFSQVDENIDNISKEMPVQLSFRHITTIVQIKGGNIDATLDFFKDQIKNDRDRERSRLRITCVWNWLQNYADDQFTFSLKEKKDEEFFTSLSAVQKSALEKLKAVVLEHNDVDSLTTAIFEIPKSLDISTGDFFTLSYQAIIGKEKGPKLANFILEIGKEKLSELL